MAEIADFDEVAKKYVMKVSKEYNRKVNWWDLYGKNEHLTSDPDYQEYKISVSTGPMFYGSINRTIDKPGYMFVQWFHNAQKNQIITGQITRTQEQKTTFTWTTTKALSIGMEVKADAGVPGVFGASAKFNTSVNLKSTEATTSTTTETFSVTNTVKVDPQTSLKAEWTITDREMEISWKTDVYIDGWIAMCLDEQYKGHYLWFHPIFMLANDKFQQNSNGLLYRAKGSFFGVRGLSATLRTFEYPLQEDENPSDRDMIKESVLESIVFNRLQPQFGIHD